MTHHLHRVVIEPTADLHRQAMARCPDEVPSRQGLAKSPNAVCRGTPLSIRLSPWHHWLR